jgi:hypothetical protein
LPVANDGRKLGQVLADEGLPVVGEIGHGHLIPGERMGLEGLDYQGASS